MVFGKRFIKAERLKPKESTITEKRLVFGKPFTKTFNNKYLKNTLFIFAVKTYTYERTFILC
ncbi:hypothetical protein T190130A13A_20440 [Tenacibaculum sp. 190130A14a]|uniref:Uncharacterized protein n=1 Tax=Tenacibaculum polynesiense TaxID=3137857 RepID=A0ABM9PAS3_9FLAO